MRADQGSERLPEEEMFCSKERLFLSDTHERNDESDPIRYAVNGGSYKISVIHDPPRPESDMASSCFINMFLRD